MLSLASLLKSQSHCAAPPGSLKSRASPACGEALCEALGLAAIPPQPGSCLFSMAVGWGLSATFAPREEGGGGPAWWWWGFGWPLPSMSLPLQRGQHLLGDQGPTGRAPACGQDIDFSPLCPSLGWVTCGWRLGGCWLLGTSSPTPAVPVPPGLRAVAVR